MILTDDEIEKAIGGEPPYDMAYSQCKQIAQAQLKKVTKWSTENCDCDMKREHPIHRYFCPRCWQSLLKETE